MDSWMDLGNQIWRPAPPNLIAAFILGGIRYMDGWMDLGNQIWRPPPPNLIAAFILGWHSIYGIIHYDMAFDLWIYPWMFRFESVRLNLLRPNFQRGAANLNLNLWSRFDSASRYDYTKNDKHMIPNPIMKQLGFARQSQGMQNTSFFRDVSRPKDFVETFHDPTDLNYWSFLYPWGS